MPRLLVSVYGTVRCITIQNNDLIEQGFASGETEEGCVRNPILPQNLDILFGFVTEVSIHLASRAWILLQWVVSISVLLKNGAGFTFFTLKW